MSHLFAHARFHGAFLLLAGVLMLTEYLWHRLHGSRGYDWRETGASTLILFGQVLSRLLTAMLVAPPALWIYRHRLFDIPLDGWRPALGLFLAGEFLYYWFHRASHTVRWLWATHRVHHSSTHLNFSAAYRLGWTNALSGGWVFFLPLVWVGIEPRIAFGTLAANLSFQFLLHTEMVGRLGPLEWIFNTPSQHRVHHSCEPGLLNRNFGGVLIVFDRLFGTHAREPTGVQLRYGVAGTAPSYNPIRLALVEWRSLLKDLAASRSIGAAWRTTFGRP